MVRYNCSWVYSVMPTRIEFQISDRETGNIILDIEKPLSIFNDCDINIEVFIFNEIEKYVKVFNWDKYCTAITTNYVGKGMLIDGVL